MELRGYFQPAYDARPTGFNKPGGQFWIGIPDEEHEIHNQLVIDLTVWAEHAPSRSTYASLRIHHDGIKTLRELYERGFIEMFEKIGASTFYDVAQCCALNNIPIIYHGENHEMVPRVIYEALYMKEEV